MSSPRSKKSSGCLASLMSLFTSTKSESQFMQSARKGLLDDDYTNLMESDAGIDRAQPSPMPTDYSNTTTFTSPRKTK
jgi:hypothetical protein